ncbi:polyribonucleotide nucleotidyltransferase [Natranaerobius thermophilus]|uniref:Polyribonucleotide nucleotidyltransferase n=1 Tax=Natranaerobius thermophilus (strain ATCC BAA-1301 / DSM 18059 / JW/NM-WN-LF) TaxID=457570 RepID=PNP_NATTJ|nr:polyribonucleotide nucleotidyltransferase [Natranaerobius thermophilus]B2A3A3.1 RecName: Full=Polyribonucleotide nucleotidyltransferase; AltName: Full=Polynucleotide phosphorylase; Short=PNPase [Natranaerobius thermophilus JW/NM-WN-LF]ACB85033.1 Polyribonucleotide nucleotidyltransferase [Natranaerobius thermophilus JW/NM-WN-LF]
MPTTVSEEIAGYQLTLETGELAKQANGAVKVQYGNTVVLVTATASKEPKDDLNFFPLTVDYEERLYAVGKIPGGFIKREGKPTEKATLTARLTDRPIRPLFPDGFRNPVHIVSTVLSVDQNCPPEIASIIGASAALSISDIPFDGPIASVKVGKVNDEIVVTPDVDEHEESQLDLVVAGTKDAIMMVEAEANELPEDEMLEAIMKAHEEIKKIITMQEQLVEQVGQKKMEVELDLPSDELVSEVEELALEDIEKVLQIKDKLEREDAMDEAKQKVVDHLLEKYNSEENEDEEEELKEKHIKSAFDSILKREMRSRIIHENSRPDGRGQKEIRPVTCDVDLLPNTHGSGLFTRGQTQVLNVCTLGALGDVQILDGLDIEESKRYMHHYNFPPYSVGEAGFMKGPGRREIGHGALAERALKPMIPTEKDFPYTIRLVSEVLESNGSTSMGSVCASSLSLMDAGVPIEKAVSGIAMGLIKEGDQLAILSDIQGIEDFLGDMDFKVAGTEDGITALQMDIKISGTTREILKQALKQGKDGYLHILNIMKQTISEPREELSPLAPRVIKKQIDPDKIRNVIGPGGKMINKIIDETGVKIDIEPDGLIYISSSDAEQAEQAIKAIDELIKEPEVGEVYLGKVVRTEKYGAFVEILPGKEGLVHISELAEDRVGKTEDVAKVGDEILVKIINIDERGRINLSRKQALGEEDGKTNNDDKKSTKKT